MELAIPLVALGGLYVINNKKVNVINRINSINRCDTKEGYENKNVLNVSELLPQTETDDINTYISPNTSFTDKFYSGKNMETTNQTFIGLTGETINRTEFQHNNMVPYFGKSKSNGGAFTDNNPTYSMLDSLQGNNSLDIKKEEQAPLFRPEENIQYANGTPNQTDFLMSRQNTSERANNINPWKENIQIMPGLNKGYNTNEHLGYNSGMDARESWQPKSVDELRTATNPKVTYTLDGHMGPAQSKVQELGKHGKVERHLPDKFYVNNPNRYLTTTGIEKAPTNRSLYNNKPVNRAHSVEYSGAASSISNAAKSQSNYRVNHKAFKQLPTCNMGPIQNNSGGPVIDKDSKLPLNNRSVGSSRENLGIVSGVVSSISAPIMDIFKPTRKQELVDSVRVTGNAASLVPRNTMHDPKNITKTTTKETTQFSPFDYGSRPTDSNQVGGYQVTTHQPISNQRDGTSKPYIGAAGNNHQQTSYASGYNQTHNTHRCQERAMNHGNTNMFNNQLNQTANNNKSNLHIPYVQHKNGNMNSSIPNVEHIGKYHYQPYQKESETRLDSNLLKAFKENPYTQSLSSVA